MYENSFLQHYNSARDLINLFGENYEITKAEVFKLLEIKYALEVINENPLAFKEIKLLVLSNAFLLIKKLIDLVFTFNYFYQFFCFS